MWYHAFTKTLYKRDETVATPRVLELLMSAGGFARSSTSDQRNRLVEYYRDWFSSDYKIHTIDNIRATQRLTSHSKAMSLPVGVVLQAILLEASGAEALHPTGTRGLLDVEVATPVCSIDEDQGDADILIEDIPAEDTSVDDTSVAPPAETTTQPPPALLKPKSRTRGPSRARDAQ